VPSHGVDSVGEFAGAENGDPAPWRHSGEVDVFGDDEQCADLGNQVQDEVVFIIGAVVHGPGWGQFATAGRLCHFAEDLPVVLRLLFGRRLHGLCQSVGDRLLAVPIDREPEFRKNLRRLGHTVPTDTSV
jgi:hypothetical protein